MAITSHGHFGFYSLCLLGSGYTVFIKEPEDHRNPGSGIRTTRSDLKVEISDVKFMVNFTEEVSVVDFFLHHWEGKVVKTIPAGEHTFIQMSIPGVSCSHMIVKEGTVLGWAPLGFERTCHRLGVTPVEIRETVSA